MPLQWLVDYWKTAGQLALPYYKHRKIALEQKFGDQIIYRRHHEDKGWIYVKNQSDINEYVFGHTFSFHPHQLSDKYELMMFIDIDKRNHKLPFKYVVEVTKAMAEILKEDKIDFLLKYSGNRGFHFMWSLGKIPAKNIKSGAIYNHEHELIDKYTQQLDEKVRHSAVYKKIIKYYPHNSPLFSTNSSDKKLKHCILIDKNILRPNGVFRSPWSVHPKTELISAPITVSDLNNFKKTDYEPNKIIKRINEV